MYRHHICAKNKVQPAARKMSRKRKEGRYSIADSRFRSFPSFCRRASSSRKMVRCGTYRVFNCRDCWSRFSTILGVISVLPSSLKSEYRDFAVVTSGTVGCPTERGCGEERVRQTQTHHTDWVSCFGFQTESVLMDRQARMGGSGLGLHFLSGAGL